MVVNRNQGFTLIESVIAICLMAFLMIAFSSLLAPQALRTADTLTQQRASQVADMLLHEMYSRPFDEQNTLNIGRCDPVSNGCTAVNSLGVDVNDNNGVLVRDDFDDYVTNGPQPIALFNIGLDGPYEGFEVDVNIDYVDDNWQQSTIQTSTKRVRLVISRGNTTQPLEFNAFRSNY